MSKLTIANIAKVTKQVLKGQPINPYDVNDPRHNLFQIISENVKANPSILKYRSGNESLLEHYKDVQNKYKNINLIIDGHDHRDYYSHMAFIHDVVNDGLISLDQIKDVTNPQSCLMLADMGVLTRKPNESSKEHFDRKYAYVVNNNRRKLAMVLMAVEWSEFSYTPADAAWHSDMVVNGLFGLSVTEKTDIHKARFDKYRNLT